MTSFNNMVAQLSHFGWAALIVTWWWILFPSHFWMLVFISLGAAFLKEFVWDLGPAWGLPFGESLSESGGFWGSAEDFFFYCFGAGAGTYGLILKGLVIVKMSISGNAVTDILSPR